MNAWLIDTLVWTAALIALVLVLRRPVARWFGPQAAYALWALPLLRLALPPLTLPAWMAPAEPITAQPLAAKSELVLLVSEPAARAAEVPALTPAAVAAPGWPIALADLALGVWLAGVVLFLALRFRAYWRMRQTLLADSRDVGRAGKVRLVETPSISAPLAFGVIDKVIALPSGFLAAWDREARDLALAHELAHHRGHDLLINMAVQPLFAMHWFNPLGHLGWIALRRDQEAACDARVVADAAPELRATYARVIASFAAGPNVALAAPMACPVLGDKSIIHRLRSLRMTRFSTRRRMAGRGLLAAALITLPLTATITYAEARQDAPEVPEPLEAPEPPEAPEAPEPGDRQITIIDHPGGADPDDPSLHTRVIEQDGKTIVFKSNKELSEAEVRERVARAEASMAEAEALAADDTARKEERRVHRLVIRNGEEQMSKEEREVMQRELKEAMRELRTEMAEARKQMRLAFKDMESAQGEMAEIDFSCDTKVSGDSKDEKGKRRVQVCRSEILASAIEGLKSARASIAADKSIPEEARLEVLESLDREIENWNKEGK